MTDNEIIKALECCEVCSHLEYCEKCPYVECTTKKGCVGEMLTDALDLINRQIAEIERLRNTVKTDFLTVTEKLKFSQSEIGEIRAEAIKEFAEMLKEKLYGIPTVYNSHFSRLVDSLVEEMTENEGEMKRYKITNIGCDDITEGVFELTEEQFKFLDRLFEELNKNSTYGCMPTIYVKEAHPTEKGGANG